MPVIAANALAFVLKHWKLVLGGLGFAILGLMLMFAKADARHWHKQADQNKAELSVEVAKNGINLASIDELQRLLKAKNDESDQRAKAYAASRAQDAQDVAAADQRLRATTSQIARLRGIADHAGANPTCKAPGVLLSNAEGL